MRRLILENETYTEEQWLEIEEYNREDVLLDIQLLSALAPAIDLPHAVFWARYGVPVVEMEARGLPVDVARLNDLRDNWQAIRLHYIRRDDVIGLYDGDGSMCEDRLAALINERGWIWPGTAKSGKPELKAYTLAKQCERYPELKPPAAPARPDRRTAARRIRRHRRRGWRVELPDHAVLDEDRAQPAPGQGQGLSTSVACLGARADQAA
jgi:hypothetical protein